MIWQTLAFKGAVINTPVAGTLQVPEQANCIQLLRTRVDQSFLVTVKSNNAKINFLDGFNPLTNSSDGNIPLYFMTVPTDTLLITLTSLVSPGPTDHYLNFWFTKR